MRPPLALLLLFTAVPTFAQTAEPLVTDRPDLTESPESVAVGRVQVEGGATLERLRGGSASEVSGLEALVRVGLGRGVELRLGLPVGVVADPFGSADASASEPSLGAKLELGGALGWSAAAIVEVPMPFDGAPSSPLAILTLGRDVGERLSVGAQAEALWDREAGRLSLGATAVIGRSVTERVGGFAEVALADGGGPLALTVQGGATLGLGPDAQLDARVGVGLTETAPGVFVGVGGAVRL